MGPSNCVGGNEVVLKDPRLKLTSFEKSPTFYRKSKSHTKSRV